MADSERARYWIIVHSYDGAEESDIEDLVSKALENRYAFMQYEYGFQKKANVTNVYKHAKEIKEGDYIFLRGKKRICAYGRAIRPRKAATQMKRLQDIINAKNSPLSSHNSKDIVHFDDAPVFYFDFSEGEDCWGQRVDVEKWTEIDVSYNELSTKSGDYIDKNIRCAVRELNANAASRLTNHQIGVHAMQQNKNLYQKEIDLLRFKKNIILQGAPGTGKTYSTASIALGIIGEDLDFTDHKAVMELYKKRCDEGRIGFVTFHQSMDYEDFVEGMKPEIIGDEYKNVNYKIEDGIFKRMCRNAGKAQSGSSQDNFDAAWEKLVDFLNENDLMEVPLLSGKKHFRVELNVAGDGLAERTYEDGEFRKGEWIRGASKFFSKEQLYNIYRGLPGIPSRGHDNYRKAIVNCMKKQFSLADYTAEKQDEKDSLPYVLIIDEINRGNVSKIFGELITLIEADKRIGGTHPIEVMLPYSKEPFSVPSNLYIIGTMNTADRSVGSIDYAVRRRFAFVTLQAEKSQLEQYYHGKPDGLKEKACSLFDKVKEFLEDKKADMDIDDLMAGHSYFMAEDEGQLAMKLEYEITPLIEEYIKDEIIRAARDEFQETIKAWKRMLEQ